MNKYIFIVFASFVTVICTSCGENKIETIIESPYIKGLSTNNYPKIDGSTSTEPLNKIIACKLFDFNYQWVYQYSGNIYAIEPKVNGYNELWGNIKNSQTHNSFINLIDKKADIILSARTMSPDEKMYAEGKSITLIETQIALDAFIFIVRPSNTIQSLTTKQIQDIYTGKITHWDEVGGGYVDIGWGWEDYGTINPYVRNPNSGSQELMELLVMKDLEINEFPINYFEVIFSMAGALDHVAHDTNAICYTVYYYLEYQSSDKGGVKSVAVNGINPTKASISDRSYPYVAPVYAIIRSDLDTSSMAYKIYEWLQTEAGKQVINESGYVPN